MSTNGHQLHGAKSSLARHQLFNMCTDVSSRGGELILSKPRWQTLESLTPRETPLAQSLVPC